MSCSDRIAEQLVALAASRARNAKIRSLSGPSLPLAHGGAFGVEPTIGSLRATAGAIGVAVARSSRSADSSLR